MPQCLQTYQLNPTSLTQKSILQKKKLTFLSKELSRTSWLQQNRHNGTIWWPLNRGHSYEWRTNDIKVWLSPLLSWSLPISSSFSARFPSHLSSGSVSPVIRQKHDPWPQGDPKVTWCVKKVKKNLKRVTTALMCWEKKENTCCIAHSLILSIDDFLLRNSKEVTTIVQFSNWTAWKSLEFCLYFSSVTDILWNTACPVV